MPLLGHLHGDLPLEGIFFLLNSKGAHGPVTRGATGSGSSSGAHPLNLSPNPVPPAPLQ